MREWNLLFETNVRVRCFLCVTIIITRAQYECDPLLTAVNLQSQCEIECFFFPSLSLSLSRGFHAEYTRDVAREELESPEEQREWIPMKL